MVINHGEPSSDAKAYRQHMMSLLLTEGPALIERQMLAIMVPNGDWRKKGIIEFDPPLALLDWPVAAVIKFVCAGISYILCSRIPE